MIHLSASDIASATGATLLLPGTREVSGAAAIDSRRAGEGSLFVAFAGERVDGNAYLCAAARAGAAAVVASREPSEVELAELGSLGCAVLRAASDDCEEFLLRLAARVRADHPEWLVVGVTGSVGKTTTKDMLAAAFGSQRRTHATEGNLNNLIGLPLTVLSAPDGAEVLVCELGMNHAGEIERLAAACRPALACVTNVGTSHIGLLGSRENIARAKAEVVSGMAPARDVAPALALLSSGDFTPLIADGFRVNLGEGDATVCSDGKWVEFILGQLISNSLKYRSAAPRLTFSQAVKRDGVVLSLLDNGPGIPPEDLPRVFDKGFTGANGRHLSTRSTGLGLYLCRKLCARLGLGLSLSCPPGGGTLASLTFPLGRFHLAEGQPYKTVTSP